MLRSPPAWNTGPPLLVLGDDSLMPGVLIFMVTTSPDYRLLEGNICLPFPGYMQPGVTSSGNSVVTANVFFETESHSVAQAAFELMILLPSAPK